MKLLDNKIMENERSKTIREATLADIPTIQAIARVTFPLTYKELITPQQNDYMMEMMYSTESLTKQMIEEHHTYLICETDWQPAGYVSVQPVQPAEDEGTMGYSSVFDLQKIYVLPEFQKHHIGRFLFENAVKWIQKKHPEPCLMILHVNRGNRALHFYEHMGMRKIHEGDYPIGNGYFMNDYIMGMEI